MQTATAIADKLTPETLAARVRFIVTEMPWDFPVDEKLDFELRGKRQVEGAKIGLTHVVGMGSACAIHVLEKVN